LPIFRWCLADIPLELGWNSDGILLNVWKIADTQLQQSLQKNRLIFLQGLLFWCPIRRFVPRFEILAQKTAISSARKESI
jgi:hypothetical protein